MTAVVMIQKTCVTRWWKARAKCRSRLLGSLNAPLAPWLKLNAAAVSPVSVRKRQIKRSKHSFSTRPSVQLPKPGAKHLTSLKNCQIEAVIRLNISMGRCLAWRRYLWEFGQPPGEPQGSTSTTSHTHTRARAHTLQTESQLYRNYGCC